MDERRRNLKAFKEGDVRFLVCTDVAARGLDIKELPFVVNMTLPDKEEDYVHRVGRVGRAEVMGLAISLVGEHKEKVWYYDRRKWEGKPLSTKLASEGGCCIWYNERELFLAIEKRLGSTIGSLADFLAAGGRSAQLAAYGQAKDGGLNERSTAHLLQLAPAVTALAQLEVKVQHSFLVGLKNVLPVSVTDASVSASASAPFGGRGAQPLSSRSAGHSHRGGGRGITGGGGGGRQSRN